VKEVGRVEGVMLTSKPDKSHWDQRGHVVVDIPRGTFKEEVDNPLCK